MGQVLRRARRARGFTLRHVASRSRFKPSALGGYERGERAISLARFCELAELYGVPADRLLGEVLGTLDPTSRQEVVIDLSRLRLVSPDKSEALGDFVRRIQQSRGDHDSHVITLRSGDLEIIASNSGVEAKELLASLRPALTEPPS